MIPPFTSQWILATDPDAKLNLILQHHETEDTCYAFSFGKLQGNPDGRYQPFRLLPGRYRCELTLKGTNLEQTLRLRFANNGRSAPPTIAAESMD